MRRTLAALLLTAPGLSSCASGSTGPEVAEAGFAVHSRPGHILLTNASSAPVHYVAMEKGTAALVDLLFDPRQWPSLAAGAEHALPDAELPGHHPDARQAIVFWWTNGRYGETIVIDLM